MAMNLGNDESAMSEINVTPLVDVMLVLLTIFIVTAPLLTNAVPVNLPKATADLSMDHLEADHISVTEEGSLYFNDVEVTAEELAEKLNLAAQDVDTTVDIFADTKVEYGVVAKVMAAVQRAGIVKFTFVMEPESVN